MMGAAAHMPGRQILAELAGAGRVLGQKTEGLRQCPIGASLGADPVKIRPLLPEDLVGLTSIDPWFRLGVGELPAGLKTRGWLGPPLGATQRDPPADPATAPRPMLRPNCGTADAAATHG